MKFFFPTLLATIACTTQGRKLEDLETRWFLDTPDIDYVSADNQFQLDFLSASSTNTNANMQEYFYDRNCKVAAPGTSAEITDGITLPDSGLNMVADTNSDLRPQLKFVLVPLTLANNPLIYDVVTDVMITNENLPAADLNLGYMRFCVRSEIGYTMGGVFEAVNFIETLVTVKYDLTAGFVVDSFAVEAKDRVEVTEVKDEYLLVAYLCDSNGADVSETVGVAGSSPFQQGSLVTVCVEPDNVAQSDGIVMNGITDFSWTRTDITPNVVQEAIFVTTDPDGTTFGSPSGNGLTSYNDNSCLQADYCTFSSILFADFYQSVGAAGGSGNANLAFEEIARRLGEVDGEVAERRQLQADGGQSTFDIDVQVQNLDDGPGALKTAGGATFGMTALASFIALVSAAMLA